MTAGTITFIKLAEEHIHLMRDWLSSGEALRWYGRDEPTDEPALRQKYLIDKPRRGTPNFIICHKGAPIGHIQYYRATDYPEWCAAVSGRPGDYGLDLFIGRDDLLGQGLGTRVVKAALTDLVFAQADAKRCLLGPEPENLRAIRCYEKCGFKYDRTAIMKNGDAEYIMIIERPMR